MTTTSCELSAIAVTVAKSSDTVSVALACLLHANRESPELHRLLALNAIRKAQTTFGLLEVLPD